MADVVQFPNAAPKVREIIEECIAESGDDVKDCIVVMFNKDGEMTTRRYCTLTNLAMAGARLSFLAASGDHEDVDYE